VDVGQMGCESIAGHLSNIHPLEEILALVKLNSNERFNISKMQN
jgi:hypothetical protein